MQITAPAGNRRCPVARAAPPPGVPPDQWAEAEATTCRNTGGRHHPVRAPGSVRPHAVMYTLAEGSTRNRAGGVRTRPSRCARSSPAYEVPPEWFTLGDRDFATHVVGTQTLRAGWSLSTPRPCCAHARTSPGRLVMPPATTRSRPTSWCSMSRASVRRSTSRSGRVRSTQPVRLRSSSSAVPPRPACPRGDRGDPRRIRRCSCCSARPRAPRRASRRRHRPCPAHELAAPVVGVSPIVGGAPVRGMADACLSAIGVETSAAAVAAHYGARVGGGLLDGWLVAEQDAHASAPVGRRAAVASAADDHPRGRRSDRRRSPRPCRRAPGAVAAGFHVTALEGIGETRAGDDLAGLIAVAYEGLQDGDVVVVSSKAVSKAEGRVVADRPRESVVDDETVRVVARRGDLAIVETRHGLASPRPASTPATSRTATSSCSPPTRRVGRPSPAGVAAAARLHGRRPRDRHRGADPGGSGRPTSRSARPASDPPIDLRGTFDRNGLRLTATVPAVADEIAGAAHLVMGKAAGNPVAVLRGSRTWSPRPTAQARPHLSGRATRTCSPSAPSRCCSPAAPSATSRMLPVDGSARPRCCAGRRHRTGSAPHHALRFVVLSDAARRLALLDAMAEQWRADLAADGLDAASVERRVRRGDAAAARSARRGSAPGRDRPARLPGSTAVGRRARHVPAVDGRRIETSSSHSPRAGWGRVDLVDVVLARTSSGRPWSCRRTGSRWARSPVGTPRSHRGTGHRAGRRSFCCWRCSGRRHPASIGRGFRRSPHPWARGPGSRPSRSALARRLWWMWRSATS